MNKRYQVDVTLKNGDKIVKYIDTNDLDIALDFVKVVVERHCHLHIIDTIKIYELRELPYRLYLDDLIRDHNQQHIPF